MAMPDYLHPVDESVVPPQDLDAEVALIGAMLLDTTMTDAVRHDGLAVGDFYRDSHRTIAAACYALLDEGQPIDTTTVASKLLRAGQLDAVGGLDYLLRAVCVTPYSVNAHSYAATVRAMAHRRRLTDIGLSMVRAASDPDKDPITAYAEARREAEQAERDFSTGNHGVFTGPDALAAWAQRLQSMPEPITTGFPALNYALRGGWRRQQVHLLTAYLGRGKSSLACQFANSAITAGKRVGICSLEMPVDEMLARMVSQRCQLPYSVLEVGGLPAIHRMFGPAVASEAERQADLIAASVVLDEASGYGVDEMERRLRRLREDHGCDLLMLDLFNRVQGEGKSDYERWASVNARLQTICHPTQLGVPVVVVAQQNRAGKDKPGVGTTKGCGDIEEGSPVVMVLQMEDESEGDTINATLTLGKNRGGRRREKQIALVGDCVSMAWRQADETDTGDDNWLPPPPPRQYKDHDDNPFDTDTEEN